MVQMFMRDLKKVSALERFCYKGFLRNSSRTKFFVRLREVSAVEDVRFREVPLYVLVQWYISLIKIYNIHFNTNECETD